MMIFLRQNKGLMKWLLLSVKLKANFITEINPLLLTDKKTNGGHSI